MWAGGLINCNSPWHANARQVFGIEHKGVEIEEKHQTENPELLAWQI